MKRNKTLSFLFGFLLLLPALLSAQTGKAALYSLQSAFREVSDEVLPVVVLIDVVDYVEQRTINPFTYFYNRNAEPEVQQYKRQGLGSGVIVERRDDTVYVLTNNHVVESADDITVTLYDDRVFDEIEIVGADANLDLALLSFKTEESIPVARLGDSDAAMVGDWVLAVGNPYGFESTVTAGIISAKGRTTSAQTTVFTDYLQTDAAINQGNSGGALVNLDGEVIGINSWIASQSGGSVGLGFAIPVNKARDAINDFILKGDTQYGWLGVTMGTPTEDLREELDIDEEGAFVYGVYKNSPAMQAGVQPGDLIMRIGRTEISGGDDLSQAVLELDPDQSVSMQILREGREKNLTIKIGSRSDADLSEGLWPGFTVIPLTSTIRERYNLPKNAGNLIIAQIDSSSTARIAGLRAGDVIKSIGNKSVKDLEDFYDAINDSSDFSLTIYREGRQFTLNLEL